MPRCWKVSIPRNWSRSSDPSPHRSGAYLNPARHSWQICPATNLPAPACPLAGAKTRQPRQARADLRGLVFAPRPLPNGVPPYGQQTDDASTGRAIRRFEEKGREESFRQTSSRSKESWSASRYPLRPCRRFPIAIPPPRARCCCHRHRRISARASRYRRRDRRTSHRWRR
jgi:hypothetical protein